MNNIKVLSLKLKPKSKKYKVSFEVDGDIEELDLDEDIIIKYQILKGYEFDKATYDKIVYDIKLSKLFNRALNYLSYGIKSKHEVYKYFDKLNDKKEYTQSDFTKVIKKLCDLNYINDSDYAKAVVSHYGETKGKNYIINLLKDKQVDTLIIEDAISNLSTDKEMESALKIALKQTELTRKYPIKKQKELIYAKLLRSGYSITIINTCINKLEFTDDSLDTLKRDIIKYKKKYENKDINKYDMKNKIVSALMNKGYSYRDILDNYEA